MTNYKNSFADLRLVAEYLRALRNEIAVDVYTIENTGLDPSQYGKFPRPSRWLNRAKRYPMLSRIIHRIALPAWFFLGQGLFYYQCWSIFSKRPGIRPDIELDADGQIAGFSSRTVDVVQQHHTDPRPHQWLELPWLQLRGLPLGAKVLPAISLLEDKDFHRSLALAVLAHRVIQRRSGLSEWGLQSYTAWKWFLIWLAFDKLPGPLLITEHFDRWALLADGSVWASRGRKPVRHLTIMQHGSLNAEMSPAGLGFSLPSRLRAVGHLRAYSVADINIFKSEILSPRCDKSNLEVSFFRPSIKLTDMSSSDRRPSILFVGHPSCEDAHCALLTALVQKADLQLFYKPHPVSPASKKIKNLPWTFVENPKVFPLVDFLISYNSTLVTEYAAHDIPAVVHGMSITDAQILDIIPELFCMLAKYYNTESTASNNEFTN